MKIRLILPALLLSGIIFFSSCQVSNKETADQTDPFRLITYNVWYGFTIVPDRKEMFYEWMKNQDPDVVSLQELNEYTPEMLAADAAVWGHPYSALLKTEGFPTGVTSRYPIEEVQRTLEGFHHGLMRAKIKGIYFYIIHLHPGNWETRTREINLILEDIRSLPPGADVILAGDFNTFSPMDSVYYGHGRLEPFFTTLDQQPGSKNLKEGKLDYSVISTLTASGFVDLEYTFRDEDYIFTGSFPTKIEKEGEHGDQRRLDYVFMNPELADQVTNARIIANDTTWVLSDHLPVKVYLELE